MWEWCYGIGRGGFFGWSGSFLTMLWPIFLVVIVFYMFQKNKDRGYEDSAIRILEEEYARGNMTREEFLERKKDILK